MSAIHNTTVARVGGRYPFRPTCSCGWFTRGFFAEHAARTMADDHEENA